MMIKQGKNTIYCDECKAEIKQTKNLIETKHLTGGIQLRFFRCRNCGVKYLVDVTDNEVREKVVELRKWSEQRKRALDVNIDGLNEKQLQAITMLADRCLMSINNLQEEIKEAKVELKERYKGEL